MGVYKYIHEIIAAIIMAPNTIGSNLSNRILYLISVILAGTMQGDAYSSSFFERLIEESH